MSDRYYIEWQSTAADRYDTDMLTKTDRAVAESRVSVFDRYGGSDGSTADNGYAVESEKIEPVLDLAQQVANAARYAVSVILREGPAAFSTLTTLQPAEVTS